MLPVRCYTCGKVIGHLEDTINKYRLNSLPLKDLYDNNRIRRYCCKRMISTYIDTTQYKLR